MKFQDAGVRTSDIAICVEGQDRKHRINGAAVVNEPGVETAVRQDLICFLIADRAVDSGLRAPALIGAGYVRQSERLRLKQPADQEGDTKKKEFLCFHWNKILNQVSVQSIWPRLRFYNGL